MNIVTSAPITVAVFAAATLFLSGCIAYDAASTAVDVSTSAVSTAGDIVTSPFDRDDDSKQK